MDRDILALIKQNVRTSREVEGDIMAQMACNNVGKKRLAELCARYTAGGLLDYASELFDYSERRIRAGLREIPNGVYTFEDFIEGTPLTRPRIKIRVAVTVEDEEILFDFNGTDAQVGDSINNHRMLFSKATRASYNPWSGRFLFEYEQEGEQHPPGGQGHWILIVEINERLRVSGLSVGIAIE